MCVACWLHQGRGARAGGICCGCMVLGRTSSVILFAWSSCHRAEIPCARSAVVEPDVLHKKTYSTRLFVGERYSRTLGLERSEPKGVKALRVHTRSSCDVLFSLASRNKIVTNANLSYEYRQHLSNLKPRVDSNFFVFGGTYRYFFFAPTITYSNDSYSITFSTPR